MALPLPHTIANTGLQAFFMDKNQPDLSACRTAAVGLALATCYNPTRDCYTIDGSISPEFPAPGDSTPFGKFFAHKDHAYVEFSSSSPNISIPFSYTVNNDLFDHLGNLTDSFKVV
jgi:hypothetical protein